MPVGPSRSMAQLFMPRHFDVSVISFLLGCFKSWMLHKLSVFSDFFLAATAAAKLLRGRFSGEDIACSPSFAALSLCSLCMCGKTTSKIQCVTFKNIYEASSLVFDKSNPVFTSTYCNVIVALWKSIRPGGKGVRVQIPVTA